MKHKKILSVYALFFLNLWFMSYALATRTPDFSGYWYTSSKQTNADIYQNSCNETINANYELSNVTNSADKSAILAAEKIMFDYFEVYPTSCQIYSTTPMNTLWPSTFPDRNLWSLTIKQAGNPVILDIVVQCKIPPDNALHKAYVYAYPYYNTCEDYGCLDICTGDVVGRTLPSAPPVEGIENIGHVGIGGTKLDREINYQYQVLEVLDEDPVIQENSLKNFQERATYWGAKFEKPWNTIPPSEDLNLTAEQASLVYETGRAQMAFCPQFVLDPDKTHPVNFSPEGQVYDPAQGQWVKQLVMRCAAFRSDTFVNYAYEKALNMQLPIPSRYPYPLPVYTYFSLANIRPGYSTNIRNEPTINSSPGISLNLAEAIKAYQKDKNADIVISAMNQLSADNTLSPSARSASFIAAIEENQEAIELVKILTNDFISPKHNLENYVKETVFLFNKFKDPKIKSQLLRGLAVTYSYHIAGKMDTQSLKNAQQIRDLFLTQVALKQTGIFLTSLAYLPAIFSYAEMEDIIGNVDIESLAITEQDQIANIIVLIAFDHLNHSINQWDAFWEKYANTLRRHYAKSMARMLTEPNLIALFDNIQRNTLQKFLLENWPKSFEESTGIWIYDVRSWLVALTNISSAVAPKIEKMNCLLKKHPNIKEVSIYINQFAFDFSEEKGTICNQELRNKLNIYKVNN